MARQGEYDVLNRPCPLTASQFHPLTSGRSHFVGFHDLTPWNPTTGELVCLRTETAEDHVPTCEDSAEVVVIDSDGEPTTIGSTRAWNWQKAARQRWLPALGRRVCAYNAESIAGFECRIVDIDEHTTHRLPVALYDICDSKGFGLTVDFSRLFRLQPGYGYHHYAPQRDLGYDRDGISRIELASGRQALVLSVATVLKLTGRTQSVGQHFFTHVQISPDGSKFAFIYRCILASGAVVNHLIVADQDGKRPASVIDDKISHFDWETPNTIVFWGRRNTAAKMLKRVPFLPLARAVYSISRGLRSNRIRQGLYGEAFWRFDIKAGTLEQVGRGVLLEDGHPQVHPSHAELWVNDTYPDVNNVMSLMLFHRPSNLRLTILQLPTPASLRETTWRCDLHPRWHPSGNRVCFDSAHAGTRQVWEMEVGREVQELLGTARL